MNQIENEEAVQAEDEFLVITPGMQWYILQASTNREDSVAEAIRRKSPSVNGQIGRVMVPSLPERRMKNGRVTVVQKKLYPSYIFIEVASEKGIPEDVWYIVKETPGAIDFIGGRSALPISENDAAEMLKVALAKKPAPAATFEKGQLVKVNGGSFEGFEGLIESVDEKHGTASVELIIFGRSTEVEIECWQLEKMI